MLTWHSLVCKLARSSITVYSSFLFRANTRLLGRLAKPVWRSIYYEVIKSTNAVILKSHIYNFDTVYDNPLNNLWHGWVILSNVNDKMYSLTIICFYPTIILEMSLERIIIIFRSVCFFGFHQLYYIFISFSAVLLVHCTCDDSVWHETSLVW